MAVNDTADIKSYPVMLGDSSISARASLDKISEVKETQLQPEKKSPVNITVSEFSEDVSKKSTGEEPDKQVILERLSTINEQFPLKATSLIFEFDDANDPPIIKVVDKESGDIIRELPPKELREIAKALSDIADSLKDQAHNLLNEQDMHASGIFINERL